MPRFVKTDRNGPIKIEPQNKPIWICGCGLTKNFPFCDGAHKGCVQTEQPGKVYVYDEHGNVIETRDETA